MTVYQQITSNRRRTFILITLFIVGIVGLAFVFSYASDGGPGIVGFAGILSIFMALGSYFGGDKVALIASGAKGPVTVEENKYVYRLVENLAITAGVPMPKLYIIQDDMPNAFATGRNPEHASIAVTTGIIDLLENEELEGVIAHELSHVKNEDIKVMTVVIVLVGMVALISDFFIRSRIFGGGRDRSAVAAFAIIGIVLAIISPIAAKVIQLAVSRQREYLADASGALLTRYPDGLATALEKISTSSTRPLKHAHDATAHLYISNPFGKSKKFLHKLFSTHPPIEERVKILRAM